MVVRISFCQILWLVVVVVTVFFTGAGTVDRHSRWNRDPVCFLVCGDAFLSTPYFAKCHDPISSRYIRHIQILVPVLGDVACRLCSAKLPSGTISKRADARLPSLRSVADHIARAGRTAATFTKYLPCPNTCTRSRRYGPSGPGGCPPAAGRTPPPSAPRPPASPG